MKELELRRCKLRKPERAKKGQLHWVFGLARRTKLLGKDLSR